MRGILPFIAATINKAKASVVLAQDASGPGATALAAALLESGAACHVACVTNHIGLAGQSALLQVLEAKHGASLAGYMAVTFGQAHALYPPFLQRALACGVWYNWETRGVRF